MSTFNYYETVMDTDAEKLKDHDEKIKLENVPIKHEEFRQPPECIVFRPTAEEFKNSLKYIESIRPIGEKYGIVKIIPPQGWRPAFAIDFESFNFPVRIQHLNQLEARSRVKLEFVSNLMTFWSEKGTPVIVPTVDGQRLDLHSLYIQVQGAGGYDSVTLERKWTKIAHNMGYPANKPIGIILKKHYRRILQPFEQPANDMNEKLFKRRRSMRLLWDTKDNKKTESESKEPFGFAQSAQIYNLVQFGNYANKFKANYFQVNSPEDVSVDVIEQEFWRVLSSPNENVTVEYGADISTQECGSGFPSENSKYILPNEEDYVYSTWNLHNIPYLSGSVFKYINARISGLTNPWLYIGMCFSTFCWHIEDHWSYSINYHHWGEPKTWYGIPGRYAERFEEVMKATAPELFEGQPDLLHDLVTMLNPNVIMDAQIPVYRTDQKPGEFIVTFPRAYHAGFNQGFNCAEAVNFALSDWLATGRECMAHYSEMGRICVFSHDELSCRITISPLKVPQWMLANCLTDINNMLHQERKLRRSVRDWGVNKGKLFLFELVADELRQCSVCKTTCFLSSISCPCSPDQMVCLRHYTKLCECPPRHHLLFYRYTLDELKKLPEYLLDKESD